MTAERARRIAEFIEPLKVASGTRVNLTEDFDPAYKAGVVKKRGGVDLLRTGTELLADYQRRLAAHDTWGLLVCLQALDAGGKDGTIRPVMSGVNPQGVHVAGFKVPSSEELDHDYLWRYARRLRSHYEEVLVVRVHPENLDRQRLPDGAKGKDVWERSRRAPRYREINDWERYLSGNGFKVVKLSLNLSKEEQRTRFLKRVDVPERNWKFSDAAVRERAHWDDYQAAFSQMLSATSTDWAPWYVVPADREWFAGICASVVLAHALIKLDPRYPEVGGEARREPAEAGRGLLKEAPKSAPADPDHAKRVMLGEFVLAVMVTQMDVFHRLLGTTELGLRQFGRALGPAPALLILWELGKALARRHAVRADTTPADTTPADAAPTDAVPPDTIPAGASAGR
ncbi:PPK2 family polyphosphate kinase [Actinomadura sp. 3N508]|uniref:PPK2 family polyphosphate kinase n=1 Tax=Actinomadura sp. 3N508 TaxID=3375153 RepID=UPI0037B1D107